MSARSKELRGAKFDGTSRTVLPMARAAATLPAACNSGNHGETITATTPGIVKFRFRFVPLNKRDNYSKVTKIIRI